MILSNIYYLNEIGGKKNQEDYIWPVAGTATLLDNYFIVCDGVGGSENGEIASRIIAESVGIDLLKNTDSEISQQVINKLIYKAVENLKEYAAKQGLALDMATTFSLLAFQGNSATIAWCGDSRVYHLRKGETIYKTADHSLVASLVKSGEITEEEAQSHPQKNVILKAIRIDTEPAEIEYHVIQNIEAGDYFMLCTDGILENIAESDLKFLTTKNDTGEIDLVKSFQQFCFSKTKDNYSMYMLKVGGDKGEALKHRKKRNNALVTAGILLIALISAGAYFVNNKKLPVNTHSKDVPSSLVKIKQAPISVSDTMTHSSKVPDSIHAVVTETSRPGDRVMNVPAAQKNINDSPDIARKTIDKVNDSFDTITRKVLPKDSLPIGKKQTTSKRRH